MTQVASVRTISPGVSFVDKLARGLLEEAAGDPFQLADTLVLLPNRRSCRALREAFLRVGGGQPMLLPSMRPIGDTDEDELLVAETPLGGGEEIPPAIPSMRRLLLLARLIRDHAPQGERISLDHATHLAGDLARLLDQVQTEGLDFDRLEDLVPERYATHWQKTLVLLGIVTTIWPETLAAEGCIDPADRRNRLLEALTALWRAEPPTERVIAAGSTGSIPAVARLLHCVAELPGGTVVLPGFDGGLDAETAAAAADDQTHPQYGMLRLVAQMSLTPGDVAEWNETCSSESAANALGQRRFLVSEVMRPAATTEAWRELPALPEAALTGLERIDCPGEAEEAKVIALALRQALEDKTKTAALVTPDRGLARRVAAALRRWDLEVDDSAGVPLSQTPPGMFAHLVAEMVRERFPPVATLAALKHPLAACGRARDAFREEVRQLERWALRGPRPEPGIDGLVGALDERTPLELANAVNNMLSDLEAVLAPFAALMAAPEASLVDMLTTHFAAVEALAGDGENDGAERLWAGENGEALAEFIDEATDAARVIGSIAPAIYPALLSALMSGRVVRPRYGRHPRLHIWGPLEARLQNANLVILGGLNEGNWPRNPDPDPWLSRPMQDAFGLPLPERRVGLSAHDFAIAVCAPEVLLTRAEKAGGSPTVPSRWLARLHAVLMATTPKGAFEPSEYWLQWERALDVPTAPRRINPPMPRPPLAARPRQLSVTRIEAWMRDPYSIYARHILKLGPLDPLEADPAAADRGTVIHETLDRFVRDVPGVLPDNAEDILVSIGRDVFRSIANHPVVHAFWWPRFERVAQWFIEVERHRRTGITETQTEVRGELVIGTGDNAFRLTAIADRIDHLAGGGYAILDYKTGTPPATTDLMSGFAPQLPLEAAIAIAGGFPPLPADSVSSLAFWRLSGGAPPGEIKEVKGDLAEIAADAHAGLVALITAFDDPETPYAAVPNAAKAPRFNDYTHLARVAEWAGLPDDEAL